MEACQFAAACGCQRTQIITCKDRRRPWLFIGLNVWREKNIHASLNDFLLLKDHIIAKKPSKKQGFQYVVFSFWNVWDEIIGIVKVAFVHNTHVMHRFKWGFLPAYYMPGLDMTCWTWVMHVSEPGQEWLLDCQHCFMVLLFALFLWLHLLFVCNSLPCLQHEKPMNYTKLCLREKRKTSIPSRE